MFSWAALAQKLPHLAVWEQKASQISYIWWPDDRRRWQVQGEMTNGDYVRAQKEADNDFLSRVLSEASIKSVVLERAFTNKWQVTFAD